MSRGAGFQSYSRIAAALAMLALILPWWFRPVARTEADWIQDIVSGRDFAGTPVSVAVVSDATGWHSGSFRLSRSFLYVPFQATGARLELNVLDASGFPVATARGPANSGPDVGYWRVDIRGWRGMTATVRAGPAAAVKWISAPILSARSVVALPHRPVPVYLQTDYLYYFAVFCAVAALLFVPGWALRAWRPQGWMSEVGYLPLPGLAMMAAAGLASYGLGPHWGEWAGKGLLVLEVILAATIFVRPEAAGRRFHFNRTALICFGALVLAVVLDSAIRTPMGEDFWGGTSQQARMVASPPDSAIPYKTAVYLTQPKHTPQLSERFFWKGWSARTRGPLVPLMILGEFGLAPPAAQPGGDPSLGPWPAAIDSYYLARFVGILTNGCVLLAAASFLAGMGADDRSARFTLLWLMLSPVLWINTAFVWPKLLATYFLLLAGTPARRSLGEGGACPPKPSEGGPLPRWAPGLFLALAYYAHPIGALFALPLLFWIGASAGRRAAFETGAVAILLVLPWLAIKHAAHDHDPFLRYALGDGHAVAPAASVGSWFAARLKNVYYTLVPGAWFFSPVVRIWRHGPLNDWAAWSVQYSKSLPAELGYVCLWLPVAAWRSLRASPFARWFLLPGFILALLYWGYSADGLGRNCLEPLTIGLMLCVGITWPLQDRASRILLWLLCLETLIMLVAGMVGGGGQAGARTQAVDVGLILAAALIFALPPAVLLVYRRKEWPKPCSSPAPRG